MNWEKSSAATPLKRDFLKAFFHEEKRFFLTGGSALGLFYLHHRFSYDLDLFTGEHPDWLEIDGLIRRCAAQTGSGVDVLKDSPSFRRYRVSRDTQSEVIDIVLDAGPQIDPEKPWVDGVRIDTLHEIMLNKIATLIGRCEIKDLVDLYFLEKEGFRVEDYFEEALQKDGGLDPAMISLLLSAVSISDLPDYLIKPLSLDELRGFVDSLKRRMALLALPDDSGYTPYV